MILTNKDRLKFALIDLKRIENKKTLLSGHFSLVAKNNNVKVRELKKAYLLTK